MSNTPIAVGTEIPLPGAVNHNPTPTDPVQLLQDISKLLQTLNSRLAPTPSIVKVQFNANPAGAVQSIKLNRSYNNILVSLTKGVVNIYVGTVTSGVPDYQCQATGNPSSFHFPMRDDLILTFVVDTGSPDPATGCIYIQTY